MCRRDHERARLAYSNAKILGWPEADSLLFDAWCEGWTAMALYHIAFLIRAAATDGNMPWGDPPEVSDQFRADAKARFPDLLPHS